MLFTIHYLSPHFSHFSVICLGVFPFEIILHVFLVSVSWGFFFFFFRFRKFLANVSLNIAIFLILFLLLWNFVHSFVSVSYTWFYIFIPSPPIVSYPSLTLGSIFFIPFFFPPLSCLEVIFESLWNILFCSWQKQNGNW